VTNQGPATAENVTILLGFPAPTEPSAITPTAGRCLDPTLAPGGVQNVSCPIGDLASGGSVELSATASVGDVTAPSLTSAVLVSMAPTVERAAGDNGSLAVTTIVP
jgi:Domain of unknown function DUF11